VEIYFKLIKVFIPEVSHNQKSLKTLVWTERELERKGIVFKALTRKRGFVFLVTAPLCRGGRAGLFFHS